VKAPDNYKGDEDKVWGCISQFDANTGPDQFLARASYRMEKNWNSNGSVAVFMGDATQLADFGVHDIVQMNVFVFGSYTYPTKNGGTATVPAFMVGDIEKVGSC